MAKVYKRSKSRYWQYFFTTPGGRPIRKSSGTTDKVRAQELADKAQAASWDQERLGIQRDVLWQEAVVRWIQWAEKNIKPETLKDRKGQFRWFNEYLQNLYLSEITTDLLDKLIDKKLAEGVTYRTVNVYTQAISSVLHKCKDSWGYIDRIPTFHMLPENRKRVRFLTTAEAARLFKELPPHLNAMARFSLATGLRMSNVTGLTWEQVDLKRELAWIFADQAKGKRGKEKDIRVPLNKTARKVLYIQAGQHPTRVFTYKGQSIKNANTKAFKKALKRADIENFTWHDLRHTWASWHVQNGTPIHALKELGGWSKTDMVERYAHLAPQHLANYASNIE